MLTDRFRRFAPGTFRVATKCVAAMLVVFALTGPALAQGKGKGGGGGGGPTTENGVPEMDPGSIVAAVSLLSGSALLLAGRRKRA